MKLEGFEKFSFCGTVEQNKELIAIHEANGCPPYSGDIAGFKYITFGRSESAGGRSSSMRKGYAEAKAYLLSFANPVEPAKPKRKRAVAINQGFVIDDVRYTKTHIHGVSVEQAKQDLKALRLKIDRHTRLDKAGALDNR